MATSWSQKEHARVWLHQQKETHTHTQTHGHVLMTSFLRDINYCAVINGRVADVQKDSLLSARQEDEHQSNSLMSKHAARLMDELL